MFKTKMVLFPSHRHHWYISGSAMLLATGALVLSALSVPGVSKATPDPDSFITPRPRSLEFKGFTTQLGSSWKIVAETSDSDQNFNATWLRDKLQARTGIVLPVVSSSYVPQGSDRLIYLGISPTGSSAWIDGVLQRRGMALPTYREFEAEGYVLESFAGSPRDEVVIAARTPVGLFYGAASLSQVPSSGGSMEAVRVTDFPHFPVRGSLSSFGNLLDAGQGASGYENVVKPGTDWLAQRKVNLLYGSGSNDMASLDYQFVRDRFVNYIGFLRDRYAQFVPGIGQLRYGSNFGQGAAFPRNLEESEGYAVAGEPFTIDGDGRAQPQYPYVNFMPNGGFEIDDDANQLPDGWSIDHSPSSSVQWVRDSGAHSGQYGMKLVIGDTSSPAERLWINLDASALPELRPDSLYVISYWMKATVANFGLQKVDAQFFSMVGNQYDGENYSQIYGNHAQPPGYGGEWVQEYLTFRTSPVTDRIFIRVFVPSGKNGTVWIDDVAIRSLSGSLLNVVRQPDFPAHDLRVTSPGGQTTYVEGQDYSVVAGTFGVAPFYFEPDLVPSTTLPAIAPWEIHRIPSGRLEVGSPVRVSYNGYYPGRDHDYRAATARPASLEDPRIYSMNSSDQFYNTLYVRNFSNLYGKYANPAEMNLPRPAMVSINNDELRGLGADSRVRNSAMTLGQQLARFVNNTANLLHGYDANARLIMWGDMHDPYHSGDSQSYQFAHAGVLQRSAEGTEQGLISSNRIGFWVWPGGSFNYGASIRNFLSRGYGVVGQTYGYLGDADSAAVARQRAQIAAPYHRQLWAMINYTEHPSGDYVDANAADYFWNPRSSNLAFDDGDVVESFERDSDANSVPDGWSASGQATYYRNAAHCNYRVDTCIPRNLASVSVRGASASWSQASSLAVAGSRTYRLEGRVRLDPFQNGPTPLSPPRAEVSWLGANGEPLGTWVVTVPTGGITSGGFRDFSGEAVSPAGARRARLSLHGSASTETYWFDNVMLKQSLSLDDNNPPAFNGPATISLTAGSSANVPVGAVDPDGDVATTTATGLPVGATVSSDGTFSWLYPVAGTYTVQLTTVDHLFTVDRVLTVAVSSDKPSAGPAAPENFVADGGYRQISLSWSPPLSGGVKDHLLYRSSQTIITTSTGGVALVATLGSNVTSYVDVLLSPAVRYHYALYSRDDAGRTSSRVGASATVDPLLQQDTTPPEPATSLVASGGVRQVLLTWTRSASADVGDYLLFRAASQINSTGTPGVSLVGTLGPAATSFVDTGLAVATRYHYALVARDGAGNASTFAQASALTATENGGNGGGNGGGGANDTTPPASPSSFRAVGAVTSTALSWVAPADAAGYSLYRSLTPIVSPTSSGVLNISNPQAPAAAFTDAPLEPGTRYHYAIRARDAAGNWSLLATTSATTTEPQGTPAPEGGELPELAGRLVRSTSESTVYYVGADGRRYVFPNEATYFTWYHNFDNVEWLSDAEVAALQIGPIIPLRPGIKLMKYPSVPSVYAVEPGGVLRSIRDEAQLASLGYRLNQVVDISEAFAAAYRTGDELSLPPNGSVVAASAGGQLYYIQDGRRRPMTAEVMRSHRYFPNHVRITDPAMLDQVPLGAPVGSYDPSVEGRPDATQ